MPMPLLNGQDVKISLQSSRIWSSPKVFPWVRNFIPHCLQLWHCTMADRLTLLAVKDHICSIWWNGKSSQKVYIAKMNSKALCHPKHTHIPFALICCWYIYLNFPLLLVLPFYSFFLFTDLNITKSNNL